MSNETQQKNRTSPAVAEKSSNIIKTRLSMNNLFKFTHYLGK